MAVMERRCPSHDVHAARDAALAALLQLLQLEHEHGVRAGARRVHVRGGRHLAEQAL